MSEPVAVVLPRPPAPPPPAPPPPVTPPPAPPPPVAPAATDSEPAFWIPADNPDGSLPHGLRVQPRSHRSQGVPTVRRRPARRPRRPVFGLLATLVLALLAAFFAWVSAEPLLLAAGLGTPGEATVTRCVGSGLEQRCRGNFKPADGSPAYRVAVLGLSAADGRPGRIVPAHVVGRQADRAYAGEDRLALHLRWAAGAVLLALCGAGVAWASGASRLTDRRARRWAVLTSLGAPALLLAGFVTAAAVW